MSLARDREFCPVSLDSVLTPQNQKIGLCSLYYIVTLDNGFLIYPELGCRYRHFYVSILSTLSDGMVRTILNAELWCSNHLAVFSLLIKSLSKFVSCVNWNSLSITGNFCIYTSYSVDYTLIYQAIACSATVWFTPMRNWTKMRLLRMTLRWVRIWIVSRLQHVLTCFVLCAQVLLFTIVII